MAAATKLAGYSWDAPDEARAQPPSWAALTPEQWAALDPRLRAQLLQVSLGLDETWAARTAPPSPDRAWLASGSVASMPLPTAEPGPEPETVIIHAAAPCRLATEPPRRARRTSDID
jgi:hypothetical protein